VPDHVAAEAHDPPVGYLELFYDLVFVAATMVISNRFSSDLTWRSAATCASVFGLLWVFWFHTTLLMNVERRDDLGHRALVLLQMFGITLTVLAFADKGNSNNDYLGIAFGLVTLVLVVMYQRAGRDDPDMRVWAVQRRNLLLVAAALVTVTTWVPSGLDDLVFLLAMALLLVPSRGVFRVKLPPPPVDVPHLSERAALLTLIMMGEAFVKVALVVSNGAIGRDDVAAMVVEFVAVFALWLVYYDDIPKAGVRRGRTRAELWTLAHLPLQLGIVAIAVGISKFLQVDDHGVHDEVVLILGFGFVGVYGGLALVGVLSDRHPIRPLTTARLVMVVASLVLCAITWTYAWFTPFQLLVALAACELLHAYVADRLRRSTFVGPRPATP
jgi:low temperature requirement protein LtrA